MSNTYHAQPYDISKTGFYFSDMPSYEAGVEASGAEEFELQFIDGDDAALFKACDVNQSNLEFWFDDVEPMGDSEKVALFYLCESGGGSMEDAFDKTEDVAIYQGPLSEAAAEMFDDVYLSDVPESVRAYIDYDKFARDCEIGGDMYEFEFNGTTYTCTNASCV